MAAAPASWSCPAPCSSPRNLTCFFPVVWPRCSWPSFPAWPCSCRLTGCSRASDVLGTAGSGLKRQSGRDLLEWVMALGPHPATLSQDPWLQRSLAHRQLTGCPVALLRSGQGPARELMPARSLQPHLDEKLSFCCKLLLLPELCPAVLAMLKRLM